MNKIDYSRIRTLADLRRERMRVNAELASVEKRLADRYDNLTQLCSFSYLVDRVTAKAGTIYTMIDWALSGYQFIRSLVDPYRTQRSNANEDI